jgi:hypothetical protein
MAQVKQSSEWSKRMYEEEIPPPQKKTLFQIALHEL